VCTRTPKPNNSRVLPSRLGPQDTPDGRSPDGPFNEPEFYQADSGPQVMPGLPNPGLHISPDGRSPDGPRIMPELPTLGPQVWPKGVVVELLQEEELSSSRLFDVPNVDVLLEELLEGGLFEAPDERTINVLNEEEQVHFVLWKDVLAIEPELRLERRLPEAAVQVWPHRDEMLTGVVVDVPLPQKGLSGDGLFDVLNMETPDEWHCHAPCSVVQRRTVLTWKDAPLPVFKEQDGMVYHLDWGGAAPDTPVFVLTFPYTLPSFLLSFDSLFPPTSSPLPPLLLSILPQVSKLTPPFLPSSSSFTSALSSSMFSTPSSHDSTPIPSRPRSSSFTMSCTLTLPCGFTLTRVLTLTCVLPSPCALTLPCAPTLP
jgi:hypothetical protein